MSSDLLASFAAALTAGSIRVVDLTQTLGPTTPVIQLPPPFAPSQPFRLEEISHYDERGPAWYWNNLSCGEHTGTHFDARRTGSAAASAAKPIPIPSRRGRSSPRPA